MENVIYLFISVLFPLYVVEFGKFKIIIINVKLI